VTLRAYVPTAILVCATAAGLGLPAAGRGASGASGSGGGTPTGGGGTSGGGGLSPGPGGSSSGPQAQPANVPVSATAGGITVATDSSAPLRSSLRFTGSVPESDAGDVIEIQRSSQQTEWSWTTAAESTVQSDGSFTIVWRTTQAGQLTIRTVLASAGATSSSGGGTSASPEAGASASSGWPTLTVNVYRKSIATLFGPGFYGHRTACGEVLRRSTIGVANRTLPCGTPVSVYYQGRTLVVPVIDRGPYANGANWDLTMAAGRALGIEGTVKVGVVPLQQTTS
jgi:rare lipoprotein A